jgi:two-component system chemotaxis response regulator CheY
LSNLNLEQLDVLLVEPSGTQHRIIEDHLHQLGVTHIRWVQDAESALKAMETVLPDLVISAMHLPDITGTELVQRMRERERFQDLPFLLISSETSVRYLEPLRQAGVIGILPKPFTSEQLARSLYNTLDFLEPEALQLKRYSPDELHVLIVDDSSTSRRMVRQVLERMGVERFQEAENGKEAIALIEAQYFDLIITDLNMPEMDGRELSHYIRHQSSQPGVPVLMVTSQQDRSRLAGIEQAGVSAVFDKPFGPDVLRTMIEKVLA